VADIAVSAEREADRDYGWAPRKSRSLAVRERQTVLALVDIALLLALSAFLYVMHWGPSSFTLQGGLTALSWLLAGYFSGLYTLSVASRLRSLVEALLKTLVGMDAILLIAFYIHPVFVSRTDILIIAVVGPLIVGLWRLTVGRFVASSSFERRVIIVGTGQCCKSLLGVIDEQVGHGIRVLGLIAESVEVSGRVHGVPVLGGIGETWSLVRDLEAEEVVLALEQPLGGDLGDEVGLCYERGVAVSLMPQVYAEVSGQVPVEHMGSHWIGAIPLTRSGGQLYHTAKRTLDVCVSGATLLVAMPIILTAALLTRLSSPGPVLFRQQRLGLHGRPFTILKFRSMYPDTKNITSIGRWLRATHLDELPQLINVLVGDMTMVGPRPKRADEGRLLADTIPLYRARQSVRPGMTGWAQINYRYAHSPNDEMVKLRYDLYYIQHQSLVLDAVIMTRTIAQILGRRGV
jgi:exopolysaccharide biosynthesis polyprenyl glycosylphosphotransferase